MAAARLAGQSRVGFVRADFLEATVPPCDAIVASLALHHIPTAETKRAFYASCREALRPGGVLVSADCFTAREPHLAASHTSRRASATHGSATYGGHTRSTSASGISRRGQAKMSILHFRTNWSG
ncbi:MAG: class I SAM-dependent methyltransferase [Longimicrobiales bacterium]